MRWWPFKREKRESSYTDTLVQQILSTATGASLALPTATGALETCAGVVARSFAAAEVQGPAWAQRALTPALLAMIGRALIREGEVLFAIDAAADGLMLWPSADHDRARRVRSRDLDLSAEPGRAVLPGDAARRR